MVADMIEKYGRDSLNTYPEGLPFSELEGAWGRRDCAFVCTSCTHSFAQRCAQEPGFGVFWKAPHRCLPPVGHIMPSIWLWPCSPGTAKRRRTRPGNLIVSRTLWCVRPWAAVWLCVRPWAAVWFCVRPWAAVWLCVRPWAAVWLCVRPWAAVWLCAWCP